MYRYLIGGHELVLNQGELPLFQDRFIRKFAADECNITADSRIAYELIPASLACYRNAPILHYNGSSELHHTERGRLMVSHWGRLRYAYGFFMDDLARTGPVRCYYDPAMANEVPLSQSRFLSLTGLSSKLLQKEAAVLHCSYVDCGGEAILFAGFSGAGKSTQAGLWQQSGKGEIINGDRALIRKKDGRWYAYGYPCCGSSDICINRTLPIKAIVLLEKGKQNEILPTSPGTVLRRLFLGLQVYPWEPRETDLTYHMAESVLSSVPVFTFAATKEADSVSYLEQYLKDH